MSLQCLYEVDQPVSSNNCTRMKVKSSKVSIHSKLKGNNRVCLLFVTATKSRQKYICSSKKETVLEVIYNRTTTPAMVNIAQWWRRPNAHAMEKRRRGKHDIALLKVTQKPPLGSQQCACPCRRIMASRDPRHHEKKANRFTVGPFGGSQNRVPVHRMDAYPPNIRHPRFHAFSLLCLTDIDVVVQ